MVQERTLHFTRYGQCIQKDAHCACNALRTAVCTEIAISASTHRKEMKNTPSKNSIL